MSRVFILAAVVLLAGTGCQRGDDSSLATGDVPRTIDNTPLAPMPLEAPKTVNEQEAIPKPKLDPYTGKPLAPEDQPTVSSQRVDLPFAPTIAMDPVDGGKLSLRSDTPTMEYQGKIYYFTSVENMKTFAANPEQFVKGALSKY